MTRALEGSVDGEVLPWAELLEINLDAEDLNIWTGPGDLTWNGKTWLGMGTLLSLGPVREQTKLEDHRVKAVLSGIPAGDARDLLAELEADSPVGRSWTRYLAIFDSQANLIAVQTMDAGQCGGVDYSENPIKDGDSITIISTITITLESEAAFLSRTHFYRMNDAMQQDLFPGDKFFEFNTDLNHEINWGSAPPVTFVSGGSPGQAVDDRINRIR